MPPPGVSTSTTTPTSPTTTRRMIIPSGNTNGRRISTTTSGRLDRPARSGAIAQAVRFQMPTCPPAHPSSALTNSTLLTA